jgi:hypothetical protein
MSLRDYEKVDYTLCYKHFDLNRSESQNEFNDLLRSKCL